jgi:hypothetical protein
VASRRRGSVEALDERNQRIAALLGRTIVEDFYGDLNASIKALPDQVEAAFLTEKDGAKRVTLNYDFGTRLFFGASYASYAEACAMALEKCLIWLRDKNA